MSRRGGRGPGRPPSGAAGRKSTGAAGRRGDGAVRVIDKGHKPSSRRWLQRQLNDAYVAEAHRLGFRSRAAFKLMELDDRFRFLAAGRRVLDLGAAPGGWTQVAVERVRAGRAAGGRVVAVDIVPVESVSGAHMITGDALDDAVQDAARAALDGPADVVMSDMAPATTGHASADHLRIVALAEAAWAVAESVLAPGGAFVCKVFQGGAEAGLLAEIKRRFSAVRHAKPPASRRESSEIYLVATGFRPPPSKT